MAPNPFTHMTARHARRMPLAWWYIMEVRCLWSLRTYGAVQSLRRHLKRVETAGRGLLACSLVVLMDVLMDVSRA